MPAGLRAFFLPAEWQVRGRDNLNEVHVVKRFLVGMLDGVIQGVYVVACPSARAGR